MSRVGLKPITIPDGVDVSQSGVEVSVKGPKGTLNLTLPAGITLKQEQAVLSLSRASDDRRLRSIHGLTRALLQNTVTGVNEGFRTQLEIQGVGYKMTLQGKELKLNIGLSHDVRFTLPEGVDAALDQNILTLTGIDKQQVFQAASAIRALKKPEPYKGKGIRFVGEYVIRKSGKAAATGKE